jgi:SAM-dependent methyltransferase
VFTDAPNIDLLGSAGYIGYDSIAEPYAEHVWPEAIAGRRWVATGKVIADLVGADKLLLSVGCGPGYSELEMASGGLRVIAGDISLKMLRIASEKLEQVPGDSLLPCRLNAYELPILPRSVDAVMAMQFLHFVGDPAGIVKEIKRVLKPGALFVTYGQGVYEPVDEDDENSKVRRYYDEGLKSRGVDYLRMPGWTSRQCREELPRLFRNHRIVESEDLVFRFKVTPKWTMRKLGSRSMMFQIGLDPQVHEEVMREVRDRMISECGEGFEEIERERCWTDSLSVFSH